MKIPKMKIKENLIDDCKKFLGKPPYNTWTNIVMGDSYFYIDMCKRYGENNVCETIKILKT